jgi:peptidyl-prolyl cis-trans isomerase A (cyclophilin A)
MNRRTFLGSAAAPLLALSACAKKSVAESPAPAIYRVALTTTKGDVVILVHRDWSPIGADHFYRLVKAGFYDNNAFFRALPGFVVQWGINGDPKVNQQWSDVSIKDDPPKVSNKIGTVVFAKTGAPDSRTTQVFVNLGDNSSSLDPQDFTPFGEIIQGMENIQAVYMGYGDGPPSGNGPDQSEIEQRGNAYLQEGFPKLDYIKTARIVP